MATPSRKQFDTGGCNTASSRPWTFDAGDGPVVATAIHGGHQIRPDVAEWLAISEADRLREEDPLTGMWTSVGDSFIQVFRSRFEVDLNRPRETAITRNDGETWGLEIWRETPPEHVIERSLEEYDRFYRELRGFFDALTAEWHSVLVLDLHSYNHRRAGPDAPAENLVNNPEINIGTGTMDRDRWAGLIECFTAALRNQPFDGRPLDVRENVKFKGRHFPEWLHRNYPEQVCVLSLEFKKFFMDEWRGTADIAALEELRVALQNATDTTRPELARVR
ncbi:MAG TPA: N-formylglutamate amidohydrolase [Woeseiaceae bacterium]|nr:N-formylglutamate amidohydrolase [Woeseiaceae bacterium]